MPTVDRFVDTETAAALCDCTTATIRAAAHRGEITRHETSHYRQPVWDVKELAAWATEREKRRAKGVA